MEHGGVEHDVAVLMRSVCARAARARVLSLVKTEDSGYAIFRSRRLVVEVLGDAPQPLRREANTWTQRPTRRSAERRQVLDPRGNIRHTWKVRGKRIRWIGCHFAERAGEQVGNLAVHLEGRPWNTEVWSTLLPCS